MRAMHSLTIPFAFITALALPFVTSSARAENAGHVETPAFADVRAQIDAAVAAHAPERVLVVFDLDNTIIATDDDIGGEHWFMRQSELIKAGDLGDAAASTVDDLLTVQGWIYTMTGMHPVEERIPTDVQSLVASGVRFMALTSRGLDVRDATLRELARHGLDLGATAPGPAGGYGGAYKPYDPTNPEAYGLTQDDVERFKLTSPKDVVFERGVMLTQGQHKGSMLKTLLAKTGAQVDVIIFVDDRPHHSLGVQEAFASRTEKVHTFRYVHELPRIEAFRASDKARAKQQWCDLSTGLRAAFGAGGAKIVRACGL